ncbi:BZ3500_MvSof-1268-A1-R1_Chr9g10802 [Microbotryum saponariae]|uniref:BZ3500_MvSof-1268-A1-R1_Chr9g10802 protein n=1 Tax=Microbotryum saponariae TaxID=289078 RepID=A0A2X0KAR8_9BASI|nr:BZ3501_MvSof-1269-A2-R1_Chr9g10550 [Microbotryum saponariae]SDA00719.1 BZ3500_MvSof-1268-A1-R1_Chr9g10802 [Microbotryum saponariae]
MSSSELSLESTKRFHRVPIGFGPAPTPRQDHEGKRFDWSKAQAKTIDVTYTSDHAALDAILLDGYATDKSKDAVVLFEVMELRNLPWLNGRGYNTWGVYVANVVCLRTKKPYTGSYISVLFETFTDPITTGREARTAPISFGAEFMRLELSGLVDKPVEEAPAHHPRAWTHPTQSGILHHRYVPTVGQPGQHDASYTTWCPPPPGKAPVIAYQTVEKADLNSIRLEIFEKSWEELPTLWNVVKGLKSLSRKEVLEVAVQTFQGASDLITNQKVE